ncbi:RNA 2',3'-cyclic phosphodiesterase [Psychrobacillus vulpis]|uniref:RNA 2',3'-cyclic phosphodiesterase n=1 Tax=Psychrobacillus vulpis TaxID=2325572 RepID=A0A544TKN1_9BACI|nr:RNA 2',3'-cyclic phosphodiesterase [Psychrobacillus vulpis]TQR18004.1 RNA 2',3'-cyclic phosphodiesterase [Psychrobacillus vulpis]
MKTHYFIGIKIPSSIANSIVEAREKTNLHETHKTLPVAEDLHITLVYLGYLDELVINQMIQSLQKIDWNSFDLLTDGLSHFGNERTPRVVYIALEESEFLLRLQQNVMEAISNLVEGLNSNDFKAHITIAKKWKSDALQLTNGFLLEKQSFKVNNFTLYKINPNSIPRYEEVSLIHCRRVT